MEIHFSSEQFGRAGENSGLRKKSSRGGAGLLGRIGYGGDGPIWQARYCGAKEAQAVAAAAEQGNPNCWIGGIMVHQENQAAPVTGFFGRVTSS